VAYSELSNFKTNNKNCHVVYSDLTNSNSNPVDLSIKSATVHQQPVILSVPQYNPAIESGNQYNPETTAPQYNLPSTTITIHTPGNIN
jgi:hypothetical protein